MSRSVLAGWTVVMGITCYMVGASKEHYDDNDRNLPLWRIRHGPNA